MTSRNVAKSCLRHEVFSLEKIKELNVSKEEASIWIDAGLTWLETENFGGSSLSFFSLKTECPHDLLTETVIEKKFFSRENRTEARFLVRPISRFYVR